MRETRGGSTLESACMCMLFGAGGGGGGGSVLLESWLANDSQRSRLAAQLQSKHACLLSGARPRQPTWLATIDVKTNTR